MTGIDISMGPDDLFRFLVATTMTAKKPVIIWGEPGVAKSATVWQAAEQLGVQVYDFRAYLHQPVDLTGGIEIKDGRTHFRPPDFLPRDGSGIFLIEELGNAPKDMQAVCLGLLMDRKIGDYTLPPKWTCVAISNRQWDRSGAQGLFSTVNNRFATHIEIEASHPVWDKWAAKEGVMPQVRSYLQMVPEALQEFEPAKETRSFPTQRSWTNLAALLPFTPRDLWFKIAAGAVGVGRAAEFIAHAEVWDDLPKPQDVLAAAETHELPTEASVVYALVNALTAHLREASKAGRDLAAISEAIATVALRYSTGDTADGAFRKEQATLLMRDAVIIDSAVITGDAGAKWAAANSEMVDHIQL